MPQNNKIGAISALIALFILYYSHSCQASSSSNVVVNEVAWMGTKLDGIESKNWWRYEWIELFNNDSSPVVLSGWRLELHRSDLDFSLPLVGQIPSNGYFLITASDKISDYDQNYSNLKGYFNNSGEKILLLDNNNTISDEINCVSGWFGGDNETKQTMERINPLLSGDIPSNWANSVLPGGTPKNKNSAYPATGNENIPNTAADESTPGGMQTKEAVASAVAQAEENQQTAAYPSGIIFSELLPSPQGPDETEEWIEIYNENSFPVDLSGWKISDTSGVTTDYSLPEQTIISQNQFLVLSRPQTKITLNNDGDGLRLLRPDGILADSVDYASAPTNESYSLAGNVWRWSNVLTPGVENVFPNDKTIALENSTAPPGQKVLGEETKIATNAPAEENQLPEYRNSLLAIFAVFLALASGALILLLKKVATK